MLCLHGSLHVCIACSINSFSFYIHLFSSDFEEATTTAKTTNFIYANIFLTWLLCIILCVFLYNIDLLVDYFFHIFVFVFFFSCDSRSFFAKTFDGLSFFILHRQNTHTYEQIIHLSMHKTMTLYDHSPFLSLCSLCRSYKCGFC